jgi:hypothetical protein
MRTGNPLYLGAVAVGIDVAGRDLAPEPALSRRYEQPGRLAVYGDAGGDEPTQRSRPFIDDAQKRELLKGVFDNYFHAIPPPGLRRGAYPAS